MRALALAALVACLAARQSFADCIAPTGIGNIPNGATASREEMLTALKSVKSYNSAVVAYTDCIKANGGDARRGDDEVVKLQKTADKFNAELRIFKARGDI